MQEMENISKNKLFPKNITAMKYEKAYRRRAYTFGSLFRL
jgi:hypothetical protein